VTGANIPAFALGYPIKGEKGYKAPNGFFETNYLNKGKQILTQDSYFCGVY